MALRSADLYRVTECRSVPAPGVTVPPRSEPPPDRLSQAARLSTRIGDEADVDAMLDHALEGLDTEFGFHHTMVLVADESADRLTTLASRGYDKIGVGSEVAFGAGSIGVAADSRRPIRISEMSRSRRFAAAVQAEQAEHRSIPLPGLDQPMSQLAVPMIARGELRGVLFAESNSRFAFTREDEDAFALIAGQLATALRLVEIEGRKSNGSAVQKNAGAQRTNPTRLSRFAISLSTTASSSTTPISSKESQDGCCSISFMHSWKRGGSNSPTGRSDSIHLSACRD